MNPQSVSTQVLSATGHVRAMRGGAQSHMLTASDGHAYVVKFQNNPQSPRVLANEWLACSIGRALSLTIPAPAIISVPQELVDSSPSLVMQFAGVTKKCSPGLAFGSRVISEGELFDYLPESMLSKVENLEEFAGILALDKWLANCDGRQVVFCRAKPKQQFRAHFIDFGYCFNAEAWDFPDCPLRGVYARKEVYGNVSGWESFEPWLNRIENFPRSALQAIADEMPREWADRDTLNQLLDRIDARRSRVRDLIRTVRHSQINPFGNWPEGER